MGDGVYGLGKADSQVSRSFAARWATAPAALAKCLAFDSDFDRDGERLGTYAHLKTAEDMADSDYQRMMGRYEHAATGGRGGELHSAGDSGHACEDAQGICRGESRCNAFGCSSSG